MKKFLTMAAAAVLAVCLFALAACGGASGTLSSYVSAVKKGDFEKAATYVVGQPALTNPSKGSDDIYDYIWDKTVGSFKYSVEETSVNDDETTTTISISYSCYSYYTLVAKYELATSFLGGNQEESKSTVKDCLDEMEKITDTATVLLVNDEDEGWLLAAVSATALLAIICS